MPPVAADPILCRGCSTLLAASLLRENLQTCPHCGYHFRIGAQDRIAYTFDSHSFEPIAEELRTADPLGWNENGHTYPQMIAAARKKSGVTESISVGVAAIEEKSVGAGVFDFRFMGGTLGSVTGERIVRLLDHAGANRLPVVLFTMSGGARMQEGMISLMQMAKIAVALREFQDAGCTLINVLCDPTTGGVAASIGFLGNVILAEPGALVGFSGPRVIVETIGQEPPAGFQNSENRVRQGLIDQVVPRTRLRATLSSYLQLLHGH